jgi:hypothetical protein
MKSAKGVKSKEGHGSPCPYRPQRRQKGRTPSAPTKTQPRRLGYGWMSRLHGNDTRADAMCPYRPQRRQKGRTPSAPKNTTETVGLWLDSRLHGNDTRADAVCPYRPLRSVRIPAAPEGHYSQARTLVLLLTDSTERVPPFSNKMRYHYLAIFRGLKNA